MRLSEIPLYEGERLLYDGEFEKFGLLNNKTSDNILSFLDSPKFLHETENKCITCIVCREQLVSLLPKHIKGVIISEQPYISFWRRHNEMQKPREKFVTRIGENCNISPMAYIAPNNVIIGNNVVIEEFVSVKENVVIGNNCIIRAGSVIGSQGYEFKNMIDGSLFPVEHFGGVILENNVEIQALTHVAKAVEPEDDTIIGSGSKVDAMVHISHAVKIGRNCKIVAGAIICGSACTGDSVWIGPNATVSNGLSIEDGARISLGSVVTQDVAAGKTVSGNFAVDHKKQIEFIKSIC